MKTLLLFFSFVLLLCFTSQSMLSQTSDDAKMRSYVPEKKTKRYVGEENSILNKSNCPPASERGACLKIPLDSTFSVVRFDGVGCNGPASPADPLQRNDDDVSLAIPLPFSFNLYGTVYTSVYINNNGNITFGSDFCTFTPFAFPSDDVAMVAPFFADVDTRSLLSGVVYMKMESNRLTVIWDGVGYYSVHADKLNMFEVIISDGTDPLVGIGNNVCFSYADMEWTTGDASGGIGGFGGSAATVGVNKGDGISYATLGRFDRPGTGYYGPGVDTNGVSYLDCQNFCFDASNEGNICPVAQNFPPGNLVNITAGTPYASQYAFAAPEVTQITTGGVSGVPPGMIVTIANGLTCTFDVSWDPSCTQSGQYLVCFTGIDNATDPCTTTVCVTYVVDCPAPVEMSSFISNVNGRNVDLAWTTVMEVNNSRFEIERSSSNSEWTKVGVVNGNGTTNNSTSYTFTDRGLVSGNYNYRLKQIDYNGEYAYHNLSNEVIIGVPTQFELSQNYPNPFNPTTKIDYSIPFDGNVKLTIYDAMGKEVNMLVNSGQIAGYYTVSFNASALASGIYYYRLEVSGANSFVDSKKMLLIK